MKETQSIEKINSLIDDNPFLSEILGEWNQKDRVVDIRFETADINLMFYNGVEDNNFTDINGEKPAFSDKYLYFFDDKNAVKDYYNLSYLQSTVKQVLGNFNLESISRIVICRKHVYCINNEVLHVIINVMVYIPPKIGFRKLVDDCNLLGKLTLNEFGFEVGFHNGQKAVEYVKKVMNELCTDFLLSVYVKGLQNFVEDSDKSYLEGYVNNIQFKYQYYKGNCSFSLINNENNTELFFYGIANQDNPKMRISSFSGKLLDMQVLVKDFIKYWKEITVPYEQILK